MLNNIWCEVWWSHYTQDRAALWNEWQWPGFFFQTSCLGKPWMAHHLWGLTVCVASPSLLQWLTDFSPPLPSCLSTTIHKRFSLLVWERLFFIFCPKVTHFKYVSPPFFSRIPLVVPSFAPQNYFWKTFLGSLKIFDPNSNKSIPSSKRGGLYSHSLKQSY